MSDRDFFTNPIEGPEPTQTFPCGCDPHTNIIGVQYRLTDQDYDGVSEWHCQKCGKRWGRWSKRILAEGELEPRYGKEGA